MLEWTTYKNATSAPVTTELMLLPFNVIQCDFKMMSAGSLLHGTFRFRVNDSRRLVTVSTVLKHLKTSFNVNITAKIQSWLWSQGKTKQQATQRTLSSPQRLDGVNYSHENWTPLLKPAEEIRTLWAQNEQRDMKIDLPEKGVDDWEQTPVKGWRLCGTTGRSSLKTFCWM